MPIPLWIGAAGVGAAGVAAVTKKIKKSGVDEQIKNEFEDELSLIAELGRMELSCLKDIWENKILLNAVDEDIPNFDCRFDQKQYREIENGLCKSNLEIEYAKNGDVARFSLIGPQHAIKKGYYVADSMGRSCYENAMQYGSSDEKLEEMDVRENREDIYGIIYLLKESYLKDRDNSDMSDEGIRIFETVNTYTKELLSILGEIKKCGEQQYEIMKRFRMLVHCKWSDLTAKERSAYKKMCAVFWFFQRVCEDGLVKYVQEDKDKFKIYPNDKYINCIKHCYDLLSSILQDEDDGVDAIVDGALAIRVNADGIMSVQYCEGGEWKDFSNNDLLYQQCPGMQFKKNIEVLQQYILENVYKREYYSEILFYGAAEEYELLICGIEYIREKVIWSGACRDEIK